MAYIRDFMVSREIGLGIDENLNGRDQCRNRLRLGVVTTSKGPCTFETSTGLAETFKRQVFMHCFREE